MEQEKTQTPEPEMSLSSRLINIFFTPKAVFEALDRKPDWVVPLILLIVVSFVTTLVAFPSLQELQIEQMRSNPNISAEQMQMMEAQMDSPVQRYIAYAGSLFITPLVVLILAALFHFSTLPLGGEGSFLRAFSVVSYASMVNVLWYIVYLILFFVLGRADIMSSLGFLADSMMSPQFAFFSKIDLILIWKLILIAIGLSVVERISINKTAVVVFGWYIIWIVLTVGMALVTQKVMGG